MAGSLVDVARRAGVSIATASRALNGSRHPVSTEVRERVLVAATAIRYAPTDWDPGRAATIVRVAENLRPVAEYAAGHEVRLAIEPLNRYETSLVNLLEQAVEIADAVGGPGIGVAADTFHMNIEEKDMGAALRDAGPWLAHVQVCGNDRGAPGDDHIDWPVIADALGQAGYHGHICIESFTSENRTIARAASIWRPLAPSQDELATRGLAFLRTTFGAVA